MNRSGDVYEDPVDIAGRLDALGVGENSLRESVKQGVSYVLECTKHDPPWLKGIMGTGKIIRALRDVLIPRDWTYSNPRGYGITTHPSGEIAIAVAGGDANTGRAATPTTRTEKGPATRDAIYGNTQLQFSQLDPRFPRTNTTATSQTWILLFYVDDDAEETRMELSQPSGMDRDNHVTSWSERIILPPEPFGSTGTRQPQPQPSAGDDDAKVTVERRAVS